MHAAALGIALTNMLSDGILGQRRLNYNHNALCRVHRGRRCCGNVTRAATVHGTAPATCVADVHNQLTRALGAIDKQYRRTLMSVPCACSSTICEFIGS